MDDYQDLLKNDFIKKVNQVRLETEQLAQQAREIRQLMGELSGMADRSRRLGNGPGETPGGSPEGLFGPAGFPYLLEEMERFLLELEEGARKIAGREEEFNGFLTDLEDLSGEIHGLQSAVLEAVEGKTSSLSRLTGLVRDVSTGNRTLKRDQEELSAIVNETMEVLENKEQGRDQLFLLAKTSLIQGEKKRETVGQILENQKKFSEKLETCGNWLEKTLTLYREGPQTLKNFPDIIQSISGKFKDLTLDLGGVHQGLQALGKASLTGLWEEAFKKAGDQKRWAEKEEARSADRREPAGLFAGKSSPPRELEILVDSVFSLNEKMNLLALNAFITSVQGGKRPEDLAEVFGEIRILSDQVKQEILRLKECLPKPVPFPGEKPGGSEGCPEGTPAREIWAAFLQSLESSRPAFTQADQALRDQGELAGRLLNHLGSANEGFQELTLLIREQIRYAGRLLQGLLPLKQGLRQLKHLQADQSFQVRELNRSLQKTLSQAASVRQWLSDSGSKSRPLINRFESAREVVLSLAGDLFRQGQDEERLQKELGRLRSLLEMIGQTVSHQSLKQLDVRETMEKVQGFHQKMTRDLEGLRQTVNEVIGQVRQLVNHLGPFAQDSQEQSVMNRALLEALTEIRRMVKNPL